MEDFKNKRLLILGGTEQACDAVEKARQLGATVLVTDYLEDSPAKRIADKCFMISIFDIDAVVALCKAEHIDGVMAICNEAVLPAYVEICEKAGLPCYLSREQSALFTKKDLFKALCFENGLPTIPEYRLKLDDPLKGYDDLPYPVIIKPTDNSSSRGVSVCAGVSEVPAAIQKALEHSQSGNLLVEKFMRCEDVIINYTFANGEYHLSLMGDRFVNDEQPGAGSVTSALIYPSIHLQHYLETTHPLVCKMFKSAGIRDGVMFIQAFYEDGKFYCYDPGYRTCGAQVYKTVEAANGFPQMEMLIRHALSGNMGDSKLFEKNNPYLGDQTACNMALLLKPGKVATIQGVDAIRKHPAVINFTQFINVGDEINQIGTLKQTFARMHYLCKDREALKQAIREVQSALKIKDVDGEDMLLTPFNPEQIPEWNQI